jgi:hypothetical protein
MPIDSVKKHFNFLFDDYGFLLSNDPEENTEWVVVLILGVLQLRFVEDRADIFMDVSFKYTPDAWYELVSVLLLVNKSRGVSEDIRVKNNVGSLQLLLNRYLGELISAANSEDFREVVSELKSI